MNGLAKACTTHTGGAQYLPTYGTARTNAKKDRACDRWQTIHTRQAKRGQSPLRRTLNDASVQFRWSSVSKASPSKSSNYSFPKRSTQCMCVCVCFINLSFIFVSFKVSFVSEMKSILTVSRLSFVCLKEKKKKIT